eukprot:TRINITY_DN30602_c0_g1_i1.p1 TRINITY_DN30602_c0_g1~~TRINITY_DN30602_c0_g1_i1.p1  ORF type:complete len:327 (+),score=64.07 TRINITY_DN30602_c0_g1_i1:49-1029(+)
MLCRTACLRKLTLGKSIAGMYKKQGGGAAPEEPGYTQEQPPDGNQLEEDIDAWLKVQKRHSGKIDRMKESRQGRLEGVEEGFPASCDPWMLRKKVYGHLTRSEIVFLVSEDESDGVPSPQLFDMGGVRVMCYFTSLERCSDFAGEFTKKYKSSFNNPVIETSPGVIETIQEGHQTQLLSEFQGTWQNGQDALSICMLDDAALSSKLQTIINPFSDFEFSLVPLHIKAIVENDTDSLLIRETEAIFASFFSSYCSEVSQASCLTINGAPTLVVDTESFDTTMGKLAWGNQHTSELLSHLTNFSALEILEYREIPESEGLRRRPFYFA